MTGVGSQAKCRSPVELPESGRRTDGLKSSEALSVVSADRGAGPEVISDLETAAVVLRRARHLIASCQATSGSVRWQAVAVIANTMPLGWAQRDAQPDRKLVVFLTGIRRSLRGLLATFSLGQRAHAVSSVSADIRQVSDIPGIEKGCVRTQPLDLIGSPTWLEPGTYGLTEQHTADLHARKVEDF